MSIYADADRPRDAASRTIVYIALHIKLDAECDQATSVGRYWKHCYADGQLSAVNT